MNGSGGVGIRIDHPVPAGDASPSGIRSSPDL